MNVVKTCFCLLIIINYLQLNEGERSSNGGGSSHLSKPTLASANRGKNTPRRQTTFRTSSPRSGTTPRRESTARSITTARSTTRSTLYVSESSTKRSKDWDLPPRPGSEKYHPTQGNHGPNNIKIENNYNYHYPGYYSLPVQSNYPGYYYAPSNYYYSSHDTGSTALGFFLGYSLAKLTTPTYSHYSFYDGYTPRYDHYTVHHYYHDKETVPQNQIISPNAIVGCVGDSSTVCPGNTTSLCTSNGALMCVVKATSTIPCTDDHQINCAKTVISCVNNTAPECKNQESTSINIPCVSNAKVYGDLRYIDNTIIVNSSTNAKDMIKNNKIIEMDAATSSEIMTTEYTPHEDEVSQDFCVTVMALPAEKEETQGEIFFDDAKNVMSNFLEKTWGL